MSKPRENGRFRGLARRRVTLLGTLSHAVAGWRHDAEVRDLGLGGARLDVASGPVEVGDRVVLALVAPTLWDPIELAARVAWQRALVPGALSVGVAFEAPSEEALLALFDLLASIGFDNASTGA